MSSLQFTVGKVLDHTLSPEGTVISCGEVYNIARYAITICTVNEDGNHRIEIRRKCSLICIVDDITEAITFAKILAADEFAVHCMALNYDTLTHTYEGHIK